MRIYHAMLIILFTAIIAVSSNAASTELAQSGNLKPTHEELLLKLADEAMLSHNYKKAIGLYTKIVYAKPNPFQQIALENLGLARERNNQFAHAKAEYQRYLEIYPAGEGSIRVKRRLMSLLDRQRFVTSDSKAAQVSENEWNHYGNLYQFYYRDERNSDNFDNATVNSVLSTNINYTARTNDKLSPMEVNIAATHFNNIDNSKSDEERITSMYFDMIGDNQLFDMKLGRQKNNTTSIFNRFDGVDLGYMMAPDYKLKLVLGYPVEFNNTVNNRNDKQFYSIGLGLVPDGRWNAYLYYIEQKADNILDRQEVSADIRYQNNLSYFYSALDYSLQFETTNFFLATYNRLYQDKSSLNVVANYRKSPFLTTTNALLGNVGVSSLEDLLSTLTLDEIEQLSLDSTALYKSLSIYYTQYLHADLQLTTDITVSNMSGTISTAGVEALKDTGDEYSYSVGLIRNNLFTSSDINIINLRFSQIASSDVLILSLSSQFRLASSWRINPKFRYDTRDYDDGHTSITVRPSIGIKSKVNKSWQFEMELAYEDKDIEAVNNVTTNSTRKFLYAGYIYTF
jgi:hypothetical protein